MFIKWTRIGGFLKAYIIRGMIPYLYIYYLPTLSRHKDLYRLSAIYSN